jgi:hypothetical protein
MYFRCIFNYRLIEYLDYACLLTTVVHVVEVFSFMHLYFFFKGIGKRKKPKGRLVGSVAQPVGGWVCYSLASELLVETSGWYGLGLLVRVLGLRSNYDSGVENIRRNGVAEST